MVQKFYSTSHSITGVKAGKESQNDCDGLAALLRETLMNVSLRGEQETPAEQRGGDWRDDRVTCEEVRMSWQCPQRAGET